MHMAWPVWISVACYWEAGTVFQGRDANHFYFSACFCLFDCKLTTDFCIAAAETWSMLPTKLIAIKYGRNRISTLCGRP